MTLSRQEDPRANQKERTRSAIIDAAMELVRSGVTPTVPMAAEAARVSRATAYRYFPTQELLLSEVLYVEPTTDRVTQELQQMDLGDPESRLLWLLDRFNPMVLENETQYRANIRMVQEAWFNAHKHEGRESSVIRPGRRMAWLDRVLEPLRNRLSDAEWYRLKYALCLTLGVDSVMILRDVCGLKEDDEILNVLRWSGQVLLRATLEEAAAD